MSRRTRHELSCGYRQQAFLYSRTYLESVCYFLTSAVLALATRSGIASYLHCACCLLLDFWSLIDSLKLLLPHIDNHELNLSLIEDGQNTKKRTNSQASSSSTIAIISFPSDLTNRRIFHPYLAIIDTYSQHLNSSRINSKWCDTFSSLWTRWFIQTDNYHRASDRSSLTFFIWHFLWQQRTICRKPIYGKKTRIYQTYSEWSEIFFWLNTDRLR